MKKREIISVDRYSIAEELNIESGDNLITINGTFPDDVLDYRYELANDIVTVEIEKKTGEIWEFEIEKEIDESLGINFENGMMDDIRCCNNACIFCFVDQMPEGMRSSLYVKDDDERLGFLHGNYVTFTNLKDEDIERIIKYRIQPINVSIHTTNPDLRVKMLRNKKAKNINQQLRLLAENNIEMNGQIVMCPGVNDGKELANTLENLKIYYPALKSVSVVPVGLSKHRKGLYNLSAVNKSAAKETLKIISKIQREMIEEYGTHFVYPSDEIFVQADELLPENNYYESYRQIENGVGMMTLFETEFLEGLENHKERILKINNTVEMSIITGKLAYQYIKQLTSKLTNLNPYIKIKIFAITNYHFGEMITVSGLITAKDIISQLKNQNVGNKILIPENMLAYSEDVFLDDITLIEFSEIMGVEVYSVPNNGYRFLESIINQEGI
jgi:putative radical SAM enzyme (TIGR03279 family)